MRPDFKKLLCERERCKSCGSQITKGHKKLLQKDFNKDYEDMAPGRKQGMNKEFTGVFKKTKHFNENLSPLLGYLKSKVGEKWDDVFSEIVKNCPKNSVIGAHVYEHLFDYVVTNPVFHNNEAYEPIHERNKWALLNNELKEMGKEFLVAGKNRFYVDQNGILRSAPKIKRNKGSWGFRKSIEKRQLFEKRISKYELAVKIDNIWYMAELTDIDKNFEEFILKDVYLAKHHQLNGNLFPYGGHASGAPFAYSKICENYYGDRVYCNKLNQLNTRDIKKYKLNS